jgi:tetratricopeptide (TPR) repeat protein/tRNA A-37 threonylcarbamoyl transferase component Bud32
MSTDIAPGYETLREIGRGGMGRVYLARARDGREVAVKVLARTVKKEAVDRFERERRLLAMFTAGEGFVPLLDAGAGPSGPFVVMPFMPGGTLRDRLRRGPLPIDEALALGRSLAAALGRAHERGVVHRDLKPENVLYTADGEPLVADLGLARHFSSDAPDAGLSVQLTKTGELRGTAGYMAPEQVDDARSAGPTADVFSLGAILYEALAGKPAFQGETVFELLVSVAAGSFEPLKSARPDVPGSLAATVERALAAAPGARFADGGALRRALDSEGAPAGRRVPLLLALAALVALAAGLAVVLATRHGPSRPSDDAAAASEPAAPAGLEAKLTADDARRLLDRARVALDAERGPEAIAHATSALAILPDLALAFATRAAARELEWEIGGALADAQRAIELAPDSPVIRGEALAARAAAEADHSAYKESRADAAEARRLLREGGRARALAAAVEAEATLFLAWPEVIKDRESKNPVETATRAAIQAGIDASREHAELGRAHRVQGIGYWLSGGNLEALQTQIVAIAKHPRDPWGFFLEGAVLIRQAADQEGVERYDRAVAVDANVIPILAEHASALAWYRPGDAAAQDLAEAEARRVLERDPLNQRALAALGFVAAHRGDDARAIEWLEKAAEASFHDSAVLDMLGSAYGRKGDLAKAISTLEQAVYHDDLWAGPRVHLIDLYMENGDRDKAQLCADAFFKNDADPTVAAPAKRAQSRYVEAVKECCRRHGLEVNE